MTERTQRFLVIVAALALTVVTGYALQRARQSGVLGLAPVIAPGLSARFALRFRDVTVTGYERSTHAWTLTAPVIDTERDRRTLRFSGGLKATLLDKGKPAAYLSSPSAAFTEQTKLDFSGGLQATLLQNGQPRAQLSTPKASFNTQSKLFLARGATTIVVAPPKTPQRADLPSRQGHLTVHCTQLRYDVGTRLVYCTGPVYFAFEKGGEGWVTDLTLNIETHALEAREFRGILPGTKNEIL